MKPVIRLSGRSRQVFMYLRSIARAFPNVTIGELKK